MKIKYLVLAGLLIIVLISLSPYQFFVGTHQVSLFWFLLVPGILLFIIFRKESSEVSKSSKFPPLSFFVGFVVACVHFFITYVADSQSDTNLTSLTLTAPSYILLSPFYSIFNFVIAFVPEPFLHFQFIVVSSFSYGMIGGLMASRRIYLRLIGIIILCLLILSGFILVMMSAQSFA